MNQLYFTFSKFRFVLIVILTIYSNLAFADISAIEINNTSKTLVAPQACSYQWLKDGVFVLEETERNIYVSEAGTYTVIFYDEKGTRSETKITIAINAVGAIIKVYTIGDSTVSTYNSGYYPQTGWGQVFGAFFNTFNVQVINKAVGGTSSKSFYNNQWPAIRSGLVAGDFVFIQFGINDAKHNPPDPARDAAVGGEFEGYLKRFIDDTKAKGAFPVLVSTVRRNAWNADGTPYDAYHGYPGAVRTVAKEQRVPLVDLDGKAKALMTKLGQAYVTRYWYMNYPAGDFSTTAKADNVHFQEMGAIEMARLVTEGIKDLAADPNVSQLIPLLKPQYEMAVNVNPIGADQMTTRTASYPQGLTVTLRSVAKSGSTFQKWNNNAGTSIANTYITKVTSGTTASNYTAIYQGATTCSAAIVVTGSTNICQGESVNFVSSTGVSYVWKNGSTQVGTGASYKATTSGSYTVEVTDKNACKATSLATTVAVAPSSKWYADSDADDKGDPLTVKTACDKPVGYVADNSDLCSSDANKVAPGNCGCGNIENLCTLNLEENDFEGVTQVYPNPFHTELNIQDKGIFNYRILDLAGHEFELGKISHKGKVGAYLIPGMYVLEITKGNKTKRVKISKTP